MTTERLKMWSIAGGIISILGTWTALVWGVAKITSASETNALAITDLRASAIEFRLAVKDITLLIVESRARIQLLEDHDVRMQKQVDAVDRRTPK